MRRLTAALVGVPAVLVALVMPTQAAHADGGGCTFIVCTVKGRASGSEAGGDEGKSGGGSSTSQGRAGGGQRKTPPSDVVSQPEFDAKYERYTADLSRYNGCVTMAAPAECGAPPVAPFSLSEVVENASGPGAPALPTVTPAQAAAIAVAQLRLPTVAPGIGPSPELNQWKMAAVGYPLWLWADGRTHVGPVSDSVVGMTVTLDARVSKMTFFMGDGHTANCAGTGTRWTSSVQPGQESAACGYTYTEPSLPAGPYTVRAVAYWAVRWTAGGQNGVINVPVAANTQLPVGELQSVITG